VFNGIEMGKQMIESLGYVKHIKMRNEKKINNTSVF
jgi:hypothetical protein